MTFSVLMAAYNRADTVAEAISSVLAQTYGDFELIVVDDGSSDATVEVASSFADPRLHVYSRERNGGPSAARNTGVAHATGEWVCQFDSDDLLLPDYLAEMAHALAEHPQADFAHTHAWILDEASGRIREATTGMWHRPVTPMMPHDQYIAELLEANFVNAAAMRRSVLEQVGGYDESLSHGEDWELWLRIAIAGFQALRVPGPLTICRDRAGQRSKEIGPMVTAPAAVYRRVLERNPPPKVRTLAEARLRDAELQLESLRRPRAHIVRGCRRVLGVGARLWRARFPASRLLPLRLRLRATPPAAVSDAFPGLGCGQAVAAVPGSSSAGSNRTELTSSADAGTHAA